MNKAEQKAKDIQEFIDNAWIALVGEEKYEQIKAYYQNQNQRTALNIKTTGFAYLRGDDIVEGLVWDKSGTRARPMRLNIISISDNNGWTKIYDSTDLPFEEVARFDVYNKPTEYLASNVSDTAVRKLFQSGQATHYRKINLNLPLY